MKNNTRTLYAYDCKRRGKCYCLKLGKPCIYYIQPKEGVEQDCEFEDKKGEK